jgi:hypothetical protein
MHIFSGPLLPRHLDFCEKLWSVDLLCPYCWHCLGDVGLVLNIQTSHRLTVYRFWATIGPVGAEVVGLQVLPSALSIVWLILVLPCTFSEPMGLELRADSGNIYLHAQIFTGFMYIGAALCLWFLRAWKISELEKMDLTNEKREEEIQGNDAVLEQRSDPSRHASRAASVKSKVKAAKGLWSWQRV